MENNNNIAIIKDFVIIELENELELGEESLQIDKYLTLEESKERFGL